MPLTKSKGNMYPWVSHTHTHLGGECPHKCTYCYVQAMQRRFGGHRYHGELRLIEDEFSVQYGIHRTIFVEHCNDLWADGVPDNWISRVLSHCIDWPDNEYVFQTKNPNRYYGWLDKMPVNRLLGCTIETTDAGIAADVSQSPSPEERYQAMTELTLTERVFVTVEPILKGDMMTLARWIGDIRPEFANVGADSKGTGLDEPSADEVQTLLGGLQGLGVEIRQKRNLDRLRKITRKVTRQDTAHMVHSEGDTKNTDAG